MAGAAAEEGSPIPWPSEETTLREIVDVVADFHEAATRYGRIVRTGSPLRALGCREVDTCATRQIISERGLPDPAKTIPPLGGRGIAGGEKYVVGGIMFKFAIERGSYGAARACCTPVGR